MTAGVGYEFGPFASSLTAIESRFQMNKYKAASLGVDYKISKGVLFYVEGTYFKFESNHANFNITMSTKMVMMVYYIMMLMEEIKGFYLMMIG